VVVLLFTCFPPAFARLAMVLHIPLSLMLIGIVLRGSAAAPRITLVLVLWALAAGAMVLFPSLVYLFRVFKRQPA
jgi:cytochrome bd-type quinol oxidase subunit 2